MPTGVYERTKPVWNKGKVGAYSPAYIAKLKVSHQGKKQSAETIEKRVAQYRGDKHFAWKGDSVGKLALHEWIKRTLGRPMVCSYCASVTKRRYEWASIGHTYKRDVSAWVRLCTSCHRRYDYGLIKP